MSMRIDRLTDPLINRFTGFTLVELLIVVSIIAVLMGILAPAVMKARDQARTARCMANLHQIGVAWQVYLIDNKYWFPFYFRDEFLPDGSPMPLPNPNTYYGGKHPSISNTYEKWPEDMRSWSFERPLNPYVGAKLSNEDRAAVFHCPSDRPIRSKNPLNKFRRYYHSYDDPFNFFDWSGNSYLANGSLLSRFNPVNLNMVHNSHSWVMLAGDTVWGLIVEDQPYYNWDTNIHGRGDTINLLFLDGHVAPTTIARKDSEGENVSETSEYTLNRAPPPPESDDPAGTTSK